MVGGEPDEAGLQRVDHPLRAERKAPSRHGRGLALGVVASGDFLALADCRFWILDFRFRGKWGYNLKSIFKPLKARRCRLRRLSR